MYGLMSTTGVPSLASIWSILMRWVFSSISIIATIDNPIGVGKGDPFFNGPSLEREYLDQLRGPNGEVVEYARSGSLDYNGTILDAYKVTYGSKSVTLYFDMYSLSQFMIPSGFRCAWEW